MELRDLSFSDWPAVRDIYAQGIATGNATFETEPPSWEAWEASHLGGHRLVALQDGAVPVGERSRSPRKIIGWAALSPVSDRCAYAGVAEDSVYVAGTARGKGVGKALLSELVARAERDGIWTVQAGIFPENVSSISLHRACGFRVVGVRERLGRMNGTWRDVVLMERRSSQW